MQALKDFRQFEKEMLPMMSRVPAQDQKSLLHVIYGFVEMKQEFEDAKEQLLREAKENREERVQYRKIITGLLNASRQVADAFQQGSLAHDSILRGIGVEKTVDVFAEAIKELNWERENLLPAQIHPQLRTKSERKRSLGINGFAPYGFPGVGSSKIDHWFIRKVYAALPRSLGVGVRHAIIRDALRVAFGIHKTTASITMVLSRRRRHTSR